VERGNNTPLRSSHATHNWSMVQSLLSSTIDTNAPSWSERRRGAGAGAGEALAQARRWPRQGKRRQLAPRGPRHIALHRFGAHTKALRHTQLARAFGASRYNPFPQVHRIRTHEAQYHIDLRHRISYMSGASLSFERFGSYQNYASFPTVFDSTSAQPNASDFGASYVVNGAHPIWRRGRGTNVLFFDGHVKWMQEKPVFRAVKSDAPPQPKKKAQKSRVWGGNTGRTR